MSTETGSLDIEAIAKLPPGPQRLKALSKTGLVRKWEEGDGKDGLLILDGEISSSSSAGWATEFPEELLGDYDDETLGPEAWQVLFSQNRILLERDMKMSLIFLKENGEFVKHIKRLDILFDEEIIHDWPAKKKDWIELADFISTKLNVQDLELSLDAGPTYQTYVEWDSTEASLGEVKPVYEEIVETLKKALDGRKPKSFSVYWVVFCNTEAEAEKSIMGQDYDSEKLGKIPSNKRSPFFPHGAPKKKYEFTNGIQL